MAVLAILRVNNFVLMRREITLEQLLNRRIIVNDEKRVLGSCAVSRMTICPAGFKSRIPPCARYSSSAFANLRSSDPRRMSSVTITIPDMFFLRARAQYESIRALVFTARRRTLSNACRVSVASTKTSGKSAGKLVCTSMPRASMIGLSVDNVSSISPRKSQLCRASVHWLNSVSSSCAAPGSAID